jgi:hypothetical protein
MPKDVPLGRPLTEAVQQELSKVSDSLQLLALLVAHLPEATARQALIDAAAGIHPRLAQIADLFVSEVHTVS